MKIAKKLMATLLAISLLATLCFNVSAATEVKTTNGDIGYIGADATAQTLTYTYEEFVGKKHDGTDYDYGSFDEQIFETETQIENAKSALGTKTIYGWKVGGKSAGVTAITVDGHTGKALRFTNTATSAASTLNLFPAIGDVATENNSDITGLVPYGNYQFVFWYKGSNKTLKLHYYTRVNNANTEIVSNYVCTDEWKQASINIMADSTGTIKLWLDFGEEVSSGQYVCLDDVAFYRCGVGTDGSVNLFGDDGLESTVTGDFDFTHTSGKWMYIKDAAGNFTHFARTGDSADNGTKFTMGVSEADAHSGEKSLKIVSDASTNSYVLKLRPQYVYYNYSSTAVGRIPAQNGYYTISFWIKGDPNIYGLNVNVGDSSSTEYKFSNFKSNMENISADTWRQVVVRNIPVTDGDIYADISIILYGTNQGATEITPLYLDDIQLVRQSNYVENGDFENQELGVTTSVDGFAYNDAFANNTIEITDDAISGEKALKITQNANGETSFGGVISADGILADAGLLEDVPTGEYLVSVWSKGASRPYFQYGPDNSYRGRIGDNGDSWKLNTFTISVSDTVTPNIKISFLASAGYIGASLYIDDLRYETVENAIARIGGLLDDFDAKTATANEIEYLRQWVNKLESDLDEDAVRAFRISIGDVSNNGVFDANDIISIRDYLLGNKEGTDAAFDVNGDTAADIRDLVRAVSIPRV